MSIIRDYKRYKRILQALFVVNCFFVMAGVAGLIQYVKTHDLTSLDLFLVGIGTLTFGIVLPTIIIDKLFETIKEMRQHTEETIAKIVAGWLENYRRSEDPVRDPIFWLSIALLAAEAVTENSRSPVGRAIAEFTPLLKAELHKPSKKKSKKDSA